MTPDGSKVYVANENSNNVSVIDTATNMVTATIAVGIDPLRRGGDPGRQQGLRSKELQAPVSVIDTVTDTVTAAIAVDPRARRRSGQPRWKQGLSRGLTATIPWR